MKKCKFLVLAAVIIVLVGCRTAPQQAAPPLDTDARVEIRPGTPFALEIARQVGPFQAISGIQGVRIVPTDVIITFRNDRVREFVRPGTQVNWISNLPRGLTARVREAERGSNRIVILVEGKPEVTLNEPMAFHFLPGDLQRSSVFTFRSLEAKFEILQGSLNLSEHTRPEVPAPDYILISGSVGTKLDTFDFRVNLTETALREAIVKERPIDWVVNSPEGLEITVQPALAGATVLYLTVQGTPQEVRNEAVRVTLPAHILGDVHNFNVPNELILWDIIGGSVDTVIINGSVDSAIISKDVRVNIMGTEFDQDMAPGTVVSSWISNLPQGLTARVRRVRADETTGIITVSGIPREVSTDIVKISIPASAVKRETAVDFMANVDARFAINDNTVITSVLEIDGGSSHPNWLSPQVGPLNVPALPPVKDFQGLGIVTVRTTAVHRLGADNEYNWTGQRVNYGMLIEEAQRLGAHGITNVVIDYTDHIERTEIIRELAFEHEWSDNELDKISRGILREIINNEGRFSVESSQVITRTYFGSALAIRYVEGTDFWAPAQENFFYPNPFEWAGQY